MPRARSCADRVQAWDRALQAVRGYFRSQGLREVLTPVRLGAVAIEPYIEPVRTEDGVLATSPELPMKRLLAAGSPDIFTVAPVYRRGERGRLHAEGFHLVEWYRRDVDERVVMQDVEALVATVCDVLEGQAPARWRCHGFLPLFEQTTGVRLRGDESAEALERILPPSLRTPVPESMPAEAREIFAWSALLTTWSDAHLDPWLAQHPGGVHITDYPPALAALAALGPPRCGHEHDGPLAHRFESYVAGVELCNGYRELQAPAEQRARFARVQALRAGHGQAPLPQPQAFLDCLQDPGLPPCAGAALGLERVMMRALGADALDEFLLGVE